MENKNCSNCNKLNNINYPFSQARIQELVKGGHFSKFSTRVAKMSISIS